MFGKAGSKLLALATQATTFAQQHLPKMVDWSAFNLLKANTFQTILGWFSLGTAIPHSPSLNAQLFAQQRAAFTSFFEFLTLCWPPQTLSSAVVQVFTADRNSSWNKRCCGAACLVKDNPQRSYFIRVFDIKVQREQNCQRLVPSLTA